MAEASVETIYGKLDLPADPNDLIRRFLEDYGEWGFTEARLAARLLPARGAVFDIGAYIGTFGLGMVLEGAKSVLAVEPQAEAYALLKSNLDRLMGAPHVSERAAVGEIAGRARLSVQKPSNAGASQWAPVTEASAEDHSSVALVTLRDLRLRHGDYDLVKLDVEGGELAALKGDWAWIKDKKPVVWTECNESYAALEVLSFMHWAELTPHYVAFPSFRRQSFRQVSAHRFPIAYEAAIVGGPADVIEAAVWDVEDEEIIHCRLSSSEDLRRALWRTPRWGHTHWNDLSRTELHAMLTRALKGQTFETFLTAPPDAETP